ncbi:hypothetical protein HDE_02032 [Halotydeus destructor]|nr:hypothetical protein HDE_02032 [Halotydeus destructor]
MGNSLGSCDQRRRCDGNLGLVNNKDWDYMMSPSPITGLNYVDYLPFKISTETFDGHYQVMSSFTLEENEKVEVMSSFKNISQSVVALYITWFFIAYLLSLIIKKGSLALLGSNRLNEPSYLWQILRIVCGQSYSKYGQYCFRTLETALVVSMFYLVQYYYGNYGTELLIRRQAQVIDNFDQLLASDKIPVFIESDPIMSYMNQSEDETQQALIARVPFDSNGKSEFVVSRRQSVTPATIADLIKYQNGAATIVSFIQTSIEYFYCQEFVEDPKQSGQPTLHTSKEHFYPALYMHAFHLNVSSRLEKRLQDTLRRTFETRLFGSLVLDKVLDVILYALNLDMTREISECLQHRVGSSSSSSVHVLKLAHYRLVLCFAMSAMFIAIMVLIGEYISGNKRSKNEHKLRVRKKTVWIRLGNRKEKDTTSALISDTYLKEMTMETISAKIVFLEAAGFFVYDEQTKQVSGIAGSFYHDIITRKRIK